MAIREELEALQDENGIIHAETGVTWAQNNPQSELHSRLEWDDSKAGHAHRLWQMRQIIKIVLVTEDRKPEVVSLSIDRIEPRGGYRRLDDVMRSATLRQCALSDALAELTRVEAKYRHLTELAGVWLALDKAKKVAKRRRPSKGQEGTDQPAV